MDYVSVPQVHKANQGLAIASISGYVGISDLFVLTLPPNSKPNPDPDHNPNPDHR